MSTGDLDAGRDLLDRSVDAIEASHLSTLTLTFALVTAAQLAAATGDPPEPPPRSAPPTGCAGGPG